MTDLNQTELFQEKKESTSSQEDILANLSPLQVSKKVSKIRDTSGQKCLDLSKNLGPLGLLEKTLVDTLNSVSTPYLRTWRVKVTPQGHLVFQLRASVQTTKEKGYGLLPTPMSADGTTGSIIGKNDKFHMTKNGTLRKVNQNGVDGSIGLGRLVQLWRTPDAHCGRGPSSKERMTMKLEKGMPISINDQVAHPNLMWPTPTQDSATERTKKYAQGGKPLTLAVQEEERKMWPTPRAKEPGRTTEGYGRGLAELVEGKEQVKKRWPTPRASAAMNENLETVKKRIERRGKLGGKLEEEMAIEMFSTERWPTPTARDYKDSGKAVINSERNLLPQKVAKKDKEQWIKGGGSLNPTWVEWLMGYPTGWTDLNV